MQPWDRGMNFSDQTVQEAKAKEDSFKDCLALCKAFLRDDWLLVRRRHNGGRGPGWRV